MIRRGSVDLPLHSGRAPPWLFRRMVGLSKEISRYIIHEYGTHEFIRRIADPLWFQTLACVIGFDWHSSGTTTTTCGALKVALNMEGLGVVVAGGKGATSRRTPEELEVFGSEFGLDTEELIHCSRLSAKVDNSCVQDGYQLYHHCFFLDKEGNWAVVQQGMNHCFARRYHWLSGIISFVVEPHSGFFVDRVEDNVLNMVSSESIQAQKVCVDIVRDNHYSMPVHHDVRLNERDMKVLQRAYELQPQDYEELISLRGMGPKKIRALALISELVFDTRPSWKDPARFSYAHGGKDGHPYPVDRRTYDSNVLTLREAIENAKLGNDERYRAIRALNRYVELK